MNTAAQELGSKGGHATAAKRTDKERAEAGAESCKGEMGEEEAEQIMKFLFLALALGALASGEGDSLESANGSDWLKWGTSARIAYIQGVQDASSVVAARAEIIGTGKLNKTDIHRITEIPGSFFANTAMKVGTTLDAMDRIYSEPENRMVSTLMVMEIVAARFNGAPDLCIAELLTFGRLAAASHTQVQLTSQGVRVRAACGDFNWH
jgi:hypothetical protein